MTTMNPSCVMHTDDTGPTPAQGAGGLALAAVGASLATASGESVVIAWQ